MKKLLIIGIFFLFPIIALCQETETLPKTIIKGDTINTAYPDVFIVVDKLQIKLDSTTIKQIRPDWVKRIDLIKEKKYKYLYGNTGGVLMIYPKKRFKKDIINVLKIK